MTSRTHAIAFGLLICSTLSCLGLSVSACKSKKPKQPNIWSVDIAGIGLPQTVGWVPDTTLKAATPDRGGTVFRLVRESAVAGSPRIDVIMEPKPVYPSRIEEYLTRNLREMAQLEAEHKLRILSVDQTERVIADRKAYRVRHEYTIGRGNDQVAITQVTLFMVVEGRGVTVTAAGRTELFHPIAEPVEEILQGVLIIPRRAPAPVATPPAAAPAVGLPKLGGDPSAAPAVLPTTDGVGNNSGTPGTTVQQAPEPTAVPALGGIKNLTELPSLVAPIDLGALGGAGGQTQPPVQPQTQTPSTTNTPAPPPPLIKD